MELVEMAEAEMVELVALDNLLVKLILVEAEVLLVDMTWGWSGDFLFTAPVQSSCCLSTLWKRQSVGKMQVRAWFLALEPLPRAPQKLMGNIATRGGCYMSQAFSHV